MKKIEYRGIIEKLFTLYKSEGRLDETAIQSVLSSQEYDIYSRLVVMSDDEYKGTSACINPQDKAPFIA